MAPTSAPGTTGTTGTTGSASGEGRAAGGLRDGDARAARRGTAIEAVRASAYRVPTATPEESDGTLAWSATELVVVEVDADGRTGLGYTYCHPAAAQLVETALGEIVKGADALAPGRCFGELQVKTRQLGHAGIAAMAVSALDIALWDLRARLLGLCLADALPRCRDCVPIYGSGGFTSYSEQELHDQVRGWARQGIGRVKIKVGREPERDLARLQTAIDAAGTGVEVMVDANGAYRLGDALGWAERFAEHGVRYFEEPVSSQDLEGLAELRRRAPAGMSIAAGEYGFSLPYFHHMLAARAVHILQADVTRCGGITNMLRVDGLCQARSMPSSAHCAPAISAHACCAMESIAHIEYFFDHYRIEGMLFEGTLSPDGGALVPDRSRPGHGLTFKRAEAERYAVRWV